MYLFVFKDSIDNFIKILCFYYLIYLALYCTFNIDTWNFLLACSFLCIFVSNIMSVAFLKC